jgi:NAD-dependent deacetylase
MKDMEKADLVIVIGTSLSVYPVNTLPSMTMGKKVYIN